MGPGPRVLVLALLLAGLSASVVPARAANFTVTGTFQYEDRLWNKNGFTGSAQNLPIRRADVEVVRNTNNQVLASGSTDAAGQFSIPVTGLNGTVDLYVRCRASTDLAADYHIKVVDTFVRTSGTVSLSGSTVWSITTGVFSHNTSNTTLNIGTWLTQDGTGFGATQAFNILDQAVDAFDYLATANGIGRYPSAPEFVVYGWDGPSSDSEGSNYFWQGIFLESKSTSPTDTDGWSDMVILHETGHWASDMFGKDDNTGGPHYIGDNFQDPRLSYGEGYATFFAAQVREFRAGRLNGAGQPVDSHVSIYADLGVPPSLPGTGALEFAYDFETGLFNNGTPIGQIGTANETNVTSAMWDLVDGPSTPDESPGTDDEPGDETGVFSWDVIGNYMTAVGAPNWITVEDFYRGWFVRNGPGFLQTEVDSAFVGLARMPFAGDALEPDDDPAGATLAVPGAYAVSPGGGIVISELDPGSEDKVEIQNTGESKVTLTGWTLTLHWTGGTPLVFSFPAGFGLEPGGFVTVHENGNAANNTASHLYIGANINWAAPGNGAATLADAGAQARDFVRFGGNTTTIPSGTGFAGSVGGAPAGMTLSRDADGTDTDDASDFAIGSPNVGWPNLGVIPERTIAPEGDPDFYRLDLGAGTLMVARVESPHSAGAPRIELLDAGGGMIASVEASEGIRSLAELQLYSATDRTVYAVVSHAGLYTDFAAIRPIFYLRPVSSVLSSPVGVLGSPGNVSDTADPVLVTWLNGGAYDSVRVYRDGAPVATLSGTPSSFYDHADRGLHEYGIQGLLGGGVTPLATGLAFAGVLDCTFFDDLEAGTGGFELGGAWNTTGSLAASGSFSLTDSPGGDYGNDVDAGAEIIVPVRLAAAPELRFEHICITEATYDFGIVEISTDFGSTWKELARYDMDDHPQWNDGVAGPGDWVPEVLDLGAYVGKKVRLRFRLTTDAFVVEDGWYVDNIQLSNESCRAVTSVPGGPGETLSLVSLRSNPFRGDLRLSVQAAAGDRARVDLFDVAGRRVRTLWEGPLGGDRLDLSWDGRDETGRNTASGLYFLRVRAGDREATVRALKLP